MNLDPVQAAAADQFGRQSHRYGKGHILADVSDVVSALERISPLPPPVQVLDVATGAGHTGLHLAGLGHDVTCADIAQPMLDRVVESARERNVSIRTHLHPAEAFPYDDETFDLVTCRVAAHHFSDPEKFVSETSRVLKHGGHFLLIDGSVEDDQSEAEEWTHQVEKLRDPSHNRFLRPSRWQSLCTKAGLKTIHCQLDPFKMPDLNWYFETADTPPENRRRVLELVRDAPEQARQQFRIAEENGIIVWWWRRLTLIARK
jgi:SAM-dependent methyltransferase